MTVSVVSHEHGRSENPRCLVFAAMVAFPLAIGKADWLIFAITRHRIVFGRRDRSMLVGFILARNVQ